MKARIQESQREVNRNFEYKLSICMIVKNEEKMLESCCKGLVPLMEAVSSELIIVDTGSTDRSVEIAAEYTDKVLYFKWCDDFAAARNYGLDAAKGEWLLMVDADEHFADVEDIITFFNSGEYQEYNCASCEMRNYLDFSGKVGTTFISTRMFKNTPNNRYNGTIHEKIDAVLPWKHLASYANHYGYRYETEEQKEAKWKRNMDLLLVEIEENPEDQRLLAQLAKQYMAMSDNESSEKYWRKGIELANEDYTNIYFIISYCNLVRLLYSQNQFEEMVNCATKYLNSPKKFMDVASDIDIWFILGIAYQTQEKWTEAIEAMEKYHALYKNYKAHKLDTLDLMANDVEFVKEENENQILTRLAVCYTHLDNFDAAFLTLDKANLAVLEVKDDNLEFLNCEFVLINQSHRYYRFATLYPRFAELNDPEKLKILVKYIEECYITGEEHRFAICSPLSECAQTDAYLQLHRLRRAAALYKDEEAKQLVQWFMENEVAWSPVYADVLYYAMKLMIEISYFIEKFDIEDLQHYTHAIFRCHKTFARVIFDYFRRINHNDTLKGLYWTICLKESAVLARYSVKERIENHEFFWTFVQAVADYAYTIYKPEMFEEENIAALPSAYRFGHYMLLANMAYQNNDAQGYMTGLRTALKHYPVMAKPVEALLEDFSDGAQQSHRDSNEFQDISTQVKTKIVDLIAAGEMKVAEQILELYEKANPQDTDISNFKMQLFGMQTAQGSKSMPS